MKHKVIYTVLFSVGILSGLTSCNDYLDTSSPSTVDEEFVFSNITTAQAALEGAKSQMHSVYGQVYGGGLYYASDIAGSDIMRHPEAFKNQPGRHWPECLYQNGTYASSYSLLSYQKEGTSGAYGCMFAAIGRCNAITTAIENTSGYEDMMKQTEPTELSQLYGEAVAMRATCYRELIKYYGDVQYQDKFGVSAGSLVPRDSIYDVIIKQLEEVEPLMYTLGECPTYASTAKNYYSKTYVDGLIGRMALEAGGYQTRRGDITYVDGDGNAISFERMGTENNDGCFYARRSDWQDLYKIAQTYFKKAIDNSGTAVWHDTDPRSEDSEGRVFGNPYQYFFQQLHDNDLGYADESIFEVSYTQGVDQDERSYSSGRPSNGGSKNSYPCKNYGQARVNPAFYYGVFDPNDLRRDVAFTVTGSTGKGYEKLIPFTPNSKANGGGISLNKFDENRQATVASVQRKSGINGPYMRLSEMYLGYAEACAALGDDATAKTYLAKVRNRAFPDGDGKVDEFISSEGSVLKAVIDERGFEFAGEGDRRFTLVRTGLLPEKIREIKELTRKMLDGLETNGYYTFDNGNTISDVIYTKMVDLKSEKGYRLTAQCPEGEEDDPVLYPSWRGQNDDWTAYGCDYGTDTKTNLAIKGLFSRVSDTEAAELIADGYTAVDWGKTLADYDDEYYKYLFYDYDYTKAPIYLWPFTPNILSTGGFENGYGFSNE